MRHALMTRFVVIATVVLALAAALFALLANVTEAPAEARMPAILDPGPTDLAAGPGEPVGVRGVA
jgi:hypothetical protein